MSEKKTDFEIPFKSSLVPEELKLDSEITFNCHPGISCFNECCKQADLPLTPYDVIRLKKRLGMTSTEFLREHTVPVELDAHGLPGIKMKTDEDAVCLFMDEEKGCTVYEDRPAACRYYPVGLMALRPIGSPVDEQKYFLVKENHCQGHCSIRKTTIRNYRREQGVEEYDDLNHGWYQMILKKRSSGPTVGKPSEMSLQFFFMCSYDMDRFKDFLLSKNFRNIYKIEDHEFDLIIDDEVERLKFAYRMMRQVLFGEHTIELVEGAVEKRVEERKEVIELRRKIAIAEHEAKNDVYDNMGE